MRLLLNERFTAYHHVLECLLQTLHGPNAHIGSAGNEPTQVEYTTGDDETSVAVITDFALKLEQMIAPNRESVNELIYGALEFPRNAPCIFPIIDLYIAVDGREWLNRAVAELEKDNPTNRRIAGFLCGLEIEQQLLRANWGKDHKTIGQRLKDQGVQTMENFRDIDFVKPNVKIKNLGCAMQLVRALRIRNDSVHFNAIVPSQSEIETLIVTALELKDILQNV
jgi:hypothetical protein